MEHTDENFSYDNDLTFISIHDLTPEARVLYSSDSIIDVLGYTPDEVVNKSVWDFFPPEELPYAQLYHQKGISMDKAAMLSYCRVRDKEGNWIGCECCFTIVYDAMVVCTSIYRNGLPSQKRAAEAPIIRRLFTSSPRDPRYHMLSHISEKFRHPSKTELHEPRAALFLNRFTRTMAIMYATNGLEDIIGIPAERMRGRSFYSCISENCLQDAVKCLETAKANNSIAYLRFWFRDPQRDSDQSGNEASDDSDEEMTTDTSVDREVGGGVHLDNERHNEAFSNIPSPDSNPVQSDSSMDIDQPTDGPQSRTSSGDSADPADTHEGIFGTAPPRQSSSSSSPPSPEDIHNARRQTSDPIELEAVISCASDGLVVCLRKARPMIPGATQRPSQPVYENGLFAAPWAEDPVMPSLDRRPQFGASNFAPSLSPTAARKQVKTQSGPSNNDFMNAIRDQAIFAWALTGINGSMHRCGSGTPLGESLPPQLRIWQSDNMDELMTRDERTDSASSGLNLGKPCDSPSLTATGNDHRKLFGDPGLSSSHRSSLSATPGSNGGFGNGHQNGNGHGGSAYAL